jgi:hypothetical protein
MAIVIRRFLREPSNSKCAGQTRHLSIHGRDCANGKNFAGAPEQRGTGHASADVAEGPATVEIGGTFAMGSGVRKRTERRKIVVDIIVTGNPGDACTVMLDGAQPIEVLLTGCYLATNEAAEEKA